MFSCIGELGNHGKITLNEFKYLLEALDSETLSKISFY